MTETPGGQAGAPPSRAQTSPLLVVLSGPSGAGKDALLDELARRGVRFHRVITNTTRAPRNSERDGEDYHFVSDEEFDRLIESDGLLEHAETYGHRYGVPREQVVDKLREGVDAYVRTDVQGAASIRRIEPDALLIFVAPPSIDQLEQRMRARGDEDDANIARRMAAARAEMERRDEFDHIIINASGALDDAADQLIKVLEEERRKPRRYTALLGD